MKLTKKDLKLLITEVLTEASKQSTGGMRGMRSRTTKGKIGAERAAEELPTLSKDDKADAEKARQERLAKFKHLYQDDVKEATGPAKKRRDPAGIHELIVISRNQLKSIISKWPKDEPKNVSEAMQQAVDSLNQLITVLELSYKEEIEATHANWRRSMEMR